MRKKEFSWKLIPIMLSFFVMGFVDLIGIATNHMQKDFALSDSMSGLLASMVFFWFLILSVPAGILMNKIGQRKTVILSLIVTLLALFIPLLEYSYPTMLLFCCLLGIGNTLMQVSLNPLISNIVKGNKLASSLTFGQFVKAIASFSAPIIATWAATTMGNWKLLFPLFIAVSVLATVSLSLTQIKEEERVVGSSFRQCFSLLGDKMILLLFLGIVCHVGLDVGINVLTPKVFMERLGNDLSQAGYTTSIYFLFRVIGSLSGSYFLSRVRTPYFYIVSILAIFLSLMGLLFVNTPTMLYICIALVGFGNSNIFPIFFSQALLYKPMLKNEVSSLMIMGISGGAIFPLIMGVAADGLHSQIGAVLVLCLTLFYFVFMISKVKNTNV